MSTIRSTTFAGLDPWAKGGTNPVPGSPSPGATYLTTLTSAIMDAANQYGSVANSSVLNQLLQTLTQYCIELESNGILQWNAGTTYATGAVVVGSDRKIYQALQASTALTPAAGANPTYWQAFGGVTRTTNGNGTAWVFPGGLIVQAGTAASYDGGDANSFPIPFPTACVAIVGTYQLDTYNTTLPGGGNWASFVWKDGASPSTSFTVNYSTGGSGNVNWIAIGY